MTRARRARAVATVAVLAAVVGALAWLVAGPGPATQTIQADFASAAGLYVGNQVRVLGLPVGRVTAIHPEPTKVVVTMQLPASRHVPAGAKALIVAPNVVNDRYVQLDPAYTSGPVLADHATIPMSRTASPLSVDDIIASFDSLSKALGPNGANADGSLAYLVAQAARALGTNGPALHQSITDLGGAFGALSSDGPDLTRLIDNLGSLTAAASTYTTQYQQFASELADVSSSLAGDDQDLGAALANLQQALGALATFIHENSATLGQSITNLQGFTATVAADQQAVASTFGLLPTALQNLSAAINPTATGATALTARLDPLTGSSSFASSVCGSPLLRLLLLVPAVAPVADRGASTDLGCGVNGVLAGLPTPPGAGSGPNLSLGAFVGAGR